MATVRRDFAADVCAKRIRRMSARIAAGADPLQRRTGNDSWQCRLMCTYTQNPRNILLHRDGSDEDWGGDISSSF